jgi:hypothetical protein
VGFEFNAKCQIQTLLPAVQIDRHFQIKAQRYPRAHLPVSSRIPGIPRPQMREPFHLSNEAAHHADGIVSKSAELGRTMTIEEAFQHYRRATQRN